MVSLDSLALWDVYVNGKLLGTSNTDGRWKVIDKAVKDGRLKKYPSPSQIRFELKFKDPK